MVYNQSALESSGTFFNHISATIFAGVLGFSFSLLPLSPLTHFSYTVSFHVPEFFCGWWEKSAHRYDGKSPVVPRRKALRCPTIKASVLPPRHDSGGSYGTKRAMDICTYNDHMGKEPACFWFDRMNGHSEHTFHFSFLVLFWLTKIMG